MKFGAEMTGLEDVLTDNERAIGASVTAAMTENTALLKAGLRDEVVSAGLGVKLALTWRSVVYPGSQASIDAAGWVWSKAPKLVDAFDRGVTIRSRDGFWLAIPTPAAGGSGLKRGGGRQARITPGGFERRTGIKLRFIFRRGKPSLLVADNARLNTRGIAAANLGRSRGGGSFTRLQGRTTVVVFILVPQVRLRKRLNVEAHALRAQARFDGLLTKHWRA